MLLENTKSHIEGMYCIDTGRGWNSRTQQFSWILFSFAWGQPDKFKNAQKLKITSILSIFFLPKNIKSTKKLSKFYSYSVYCALLITYKTEVTATIIWTCSWTKTLCVTFFGRVYILSITNISCMQINSLSQNKNKTRKVHKIIIIQQCSRQER